VHGGEAVATGGGEIAHQVEGGERVGIAGDDLGRSGVAEKCREQVHEALHERTVGVTAEIETAVAQVPDQPDLGDAAADAVGIGPIRLGQRGEAPGAVHDSGEALLRVGDDREVVDELLLFFGEGHGRESEEAPVEFQLRALRLALGAARCGKFPMKLDPIQAASAAQFDKQSQHYGKGHILEKTGDIEGALQHIPLAAGWRALDVATGGGHTGLLLAARGCEVTLGDISKNMLERAALLAAERGLRVATREFPAEAMPFGAGEFNLVSCRVAPHHFSNPAGFIREVARVLRPGGYFLLIDGSIEDGRPEAEAWLHQVEKLRDPSHHRTWSDVTWQRWCEAAGLTVRHQELQPMKQPDLEWYFDAAATSPENREKVRELIRTVPPAVKEFMRLGEEDGKTVWWWQRLVLVAQKP
jgi:SAM-dependent methyltransferase